MIRTKRQIQDLFGVRILANDPSMTGWGWVVLDLDKNILDMGCVSTKPPSKKSRIRKGDSTIQRISEINKVLLEKISEWDVTYMVSELPHGSQNAKAAVMIGVVAGIAQTLSDSLGIGIEWYSEGDSKKCLLGKQSATKLDTLLAVSKIYDVDWTGTKYIDEAIADALSIHNVAVHQSEALKLLSKSGKK